MSAWHIAHLWLIKLKREFFQTHVNLTSVLRTQGWETKGYSIINLIPLCLFISVSGISCTHHEKDIEPTRSPTKTITDSSVRPESSITGHPKRTSSRQTKIASSIQSVLSELREKGITRQTITESDARSFSTPFVRIDRGGRIQAYLEVEAINSDLLTRLKELEVDTELSDASLQIIQAWIPFHRLEEVSRLDPVRKIRPPDYGIPRPTTR